MSINSLSVFISGPSTGDNSSSLPTMKEANPAQEEKDDKTDEEMPDIIPGKILVGGRASIPDELQPDQLKKLENLKESNA